MERRQSTSVLAVLAAVFLLVAGFLSLVTGALFGVFGGLVAGLETVDGTGTGLFGAAGGAVVVYGVAVIVWGILEIFAATGMLVHRGWGRVLGLASGVIGPRLHRPGARQRAGGRPAPRVHGSEPRARGRVRPYRSGAGDGPRAFPRGRPLITRILTAYGTTEPAPGFPGHSIPAHGS